MTYLPYSLSAADRHDSGQPLHPVLEQRTPIDSRITVVFRGRFGFRPMMSPPSLAYRLCLPRGSRQQGQQQGVLGPENTQLPEPNTAVDNCESWSFLLCIWVMGFSRSNLVCFVHTFSSSVRGDIQRPRHGHVGSSTAVYGFAEVGREAVAAFLLIHFRAVPFGPEHPLRKRTSVIGEPIIIIRRDDSAFRPKWTANVRDMAVHRIRTSEHMAAP
ncbi:hypothetical protein CONLIGDRAFT_265411 [Coniochaeta ligniaria NRRL 30616]|uniref:Uncharacterized protein n=1 Tax=Coniochaeta ligniaria NRRL 30616 TaxID=1408157 RepID=A0A1J7IYQ0_9PEZI|nr:hypothetical protein CONLIGDRAFT_265411 [Coniochaeta ligniaria NRRL 30616]